MEYAAQTDTPVAGNSFIPFVTSPGDLRDLGRPFRYDPRRSPGLIA